MLDAFKGAFRAHPAGVAIITADTPEGPVGLTASSVASVSVEPPALSFSVTKSGGSAGGVLRAPSFLVHLLGASQAPIAEAFATSGADRFTPEQGWSFLPSGEPHLVSAPVALRARPIEIVSVGPSRLVLAEVLSVHPGPEEDRLLYQNRRFHVLPLVQAA
nr:flavin reductase family protein [Leucobacter weissii]